jgi:hypothetical protein
MAPKPSADELLFASGMTIRDYYIAQTPFSQVICYTGPGEREYVLHIGDDELASEALARLKELDARVVTR